MPFTENLASDPVLDKDQLIRVLKNKVTRLKKTVEDQREIIYHYKQQEFAKKEAFDRSIDAMPPLHIEEVG